MKKTYSDFKTGVVDKAVLADAKYKDVCLFENASNYIMSPNNTLKKRFGTRKIAERDSYSRFFPFIRGNNEKYMLELSENAQKIWAVMSDGSLVAAFTNDQVGQTTLPLPFESNSGVGYDIILTTINNGQVVADETQPADLYQIFNQEWETVKGVRLNITTVLAPLNKITIFGIFKSYIAVVTDSNGIIYKRYSYVEGSNPKTGPYKTSYVFDFSEINVSVVSIDVYPAYPFDLTGAIAGTSPAQSINKIVVDYTGVAENEISDFTENMTLEQIEDVGIAATAEWICITHNDFTPYIVNIRGIFGIDEYAGSFGIDWSFSTLGNPGKSLFSQGRLWFADLYLSKNTVIGSNVGYNLTAIQNLNPTSGEDGQLLPTSAVRFDPYEITGKINFICGTHVINFGHVRGLSKIVYGNGQAISVSGTPTIVPDNSYGSGEIVPAIVGSSIVYTNFKKDCLFSANYTIASATQGFKESVNISQIHSELLASGITDLTFTNDLNANLYCSTNDRCVCFDTKNIFGAFPIDIAGNTVIETFNLQSQDGGNLLYFYTIAQNNKYVLLCMQDNNEYIDSSVLYDDKIPVDVDIPIGNLRTDIPAGFTAEFIIQYPVWFDLTFFQDIENYVDETIVFNSGADKFIIKSATNGVNTIYFGVPNNPSSNVWTQKIVWNGVEYPYVGSDYYICVDSVANLLPNYEYVVKHQTGFLNITTDENGLLSLGDYYGNFVYGLVLSAYVQPGNLCSNYDIAERKITKISLNSANSYFTYCGVKGFNTAGEQGFYLGTPDVSPMPYWTHHKLDDIFETGMKSFFVADSSPYPSELLNIVVDFDENMII